MKYTVSYQKPHLHYIDIELEVKVQKETTLKFQLSAWRPGRYELGNFAKNIQKWNAFDELGNELMSKKIKKDLWEVKVENSEIVKIRYNYFSHELNAGSTFLDEHQLYMNPVNCMLYVIGREEEQCFMKLILPEDYRVAIALDSNEDGDFIAKNFDELADSPFIASNSLQHHSFIEDETTFHLWFQGEFKPDWELLEKDFAAYTREQIKLFGDFPTQAYHYLFQILPHSAYHGVEHSASTVIALGPSYSILRKDGKYEDLLGVSSHELFHTWNVKRIRPIEMVPYDFTQENYTRLGYLTEGATTWYGDLMLYRSKVFDDAAYFRTFNQLLDRHYNNPGVNNLPVADSSFDTWLDGYVMGAPNRKASIYTEGALVTFMLDVTIRMSSKGERSFDDVLRTFYEEYFKKGKGITEQNYKITVEEKAGTQLDDFFDRYVNGSENYTEYLLECMKYLGLKWEKQASPLFHEAYLGIRLHEGKVFTVYPNSPADKGGISVGDEIVIINGLKVNNDLSDWLNYFKGEVISMGVFDKYGKAKHIKITLSETFYYSKNKMNWDENLSKEQRVARENWRNF